MSKAGFVNTGGDGDVEKNVTRKMTQDDIGIGWKHRSNRPLQILVEWWHTNVV